MSIPSVDEIDDFYAASVISKRVSELMEAAVIEPAEDGFGTSFFLASVKSIDFMTMFTGQGETPYEALSQLSADIREFFYGPKDGVSQGRDVGSTPSKDSN